MTIVMMVTMTVTVTIVMVTIMNVTMVTIVMPKMVTMMAAGGPGDLSLDSDWPLVINQSV